MTDGAIRDRLVEHGEALFKAPPQPASFTGKPDADALLNDLTGNPHAFVLACVVDRQVQAPRAWAIPFHMSQRLGGFSMAALGNLTRDEVGRLMAEPEPLHRFVDRMAGFFYAALARIRDRYDGDASRIWAGRPSSAEVVYRFLAFDGVGPKIATMAANILAREFKVGMSDYYSVDISVDRHVRRVFTRLGLCPTDASEVEIVYRARALWPDFPGMMDLPCWEIGVNWCKARSKECPACYMRDICPSAARRNG